MSRSTIISCPHEGGEHALHALIWPSRSGAAHPPLVCVHGLTRKASDFVRLAEELSDARMVVAFDMPGRGKSAWLADKALYSYGQYKADCLHVLKTLGLETVDWLGTSMGGLIGMMLAALPQSPIRRLVLNDVGPFIPLSALKRIAEYVGRQKIYQSPAEAERHFRVLHADFGITRDEDWKEFTAQSIVPDGQGGYRIHYDPGIADPFRAITADVDVWELYRAVRSAVLILRGARSDVLLAETAQRMCTENPHAQLVTFEKCGHAPALLDDAQIHTVRSFLEAV